MSDLSPFDAIGGNPALDLVNTIANRGSAEKRRDLLESVADLERWLATFGLPAKGLTADDLIEARAIRERLHNLFRRPAHGQAVSAGALDAFGQDLRGMTAGRKLVQQGDRVVWGWASDASALHQSLFPVLVEAAELLVSGDLERVRECQGPGCGWLFVDRSRGRPRRWCSMRDCGNKAKARRHQHRRAAGS